MTEIVKVEQADREAAARLNGYADWSVYETAPHNPPEWMKLCALDFARHRLAERERAASSAIEAGAVIVGRCDDDRFAQIIVGLVAEIATAIRQDDAA